MNIKSYFNRCYQVLDNRGVKGFMVFLWQRVIRCDRDLLFEYTYDGESTKEEQFKVSNNHIVNVIDQKNIEDVSYREVLEAALSNENQVYKEGLYKQDVLFVMLKNSELVHTTFVQFESKYKLILGETAQIPLIGNCWTSEKCRGQGVYPYILKLACKRMIDRGFSKVVITCEPKNLASIAGIKKAGFQLVKEITSYIFINKFAIQIVIRNNKKICQFKFL